MMVPNPVLLEQTKRFIDENPTDIAVVRSTSTDDGAGGHTSTESTKPLQTVRLVPQPSASSAERRTVSGEVVRPDYVMIGLPDADVRDGDAFQYLGYRHEVIFVWGIGGYEIRAEVTRRG